MYGPDKHFKVVNLVLGHKVQCGHNVISFIKHEHQTILNYRAWKRNQIVDLDLCKISSIKAISPNVAISNLFINYVSLVPFPTKAMDGKII